MLSVQWTANATIYGRSAEANADLLRALLLSSFTIRGGCKIVIVWPSIDEVAHVESEACAAAKLQFTTFGCDHFSNSEAALCNCPFAISNS